MLHNIDTLGADLDAAILGRHIRRQTCLSFEVIRRRIEDRGGGLARVNGRVRLVEGLAMAREEDEFQLTYYNTMTTWIAIDRLLEVFGLSRDDLADEPKVTAAIRRLGAAAHLHYAQGREEAVGPRPGGRLPRDPVREALGRHDLAGRGFLPVHRRAAAARAATQGAGPTGHLAPRRISGPRRFPLPLGEVEMDFSHCITGLNLMDHAMVPVEDGMQAIRASSPSMRSSTGFPSISAAVGRQVAGTWTTNS